MFTGESLPGSSHRNDHFLYRFIGHFLSLKTSESALLPISSLSIPNVSQSSLSVTFSSVSGLSVPSIPPCIPRPRAPFFSVMCLHLSPSYSSLITSPPSIPPSLSPQAATNLAFLYLLEGDVQNAEKYADTAVKADRYNAKALVNRANCLFMKGDVEAAREVRACSESCMNGK